ncbi:hypothetical protein [Pontibacter pudoricolor]|uniref:hypothetical protein n=1 Tax=Pontibacter pudoricolor TaxID=2694930 RepID=UPI001390A0FC|nr:hypothetical protein [Pontibacter pudoricolor]
MEELRQLVKLLEEQGKGSGGALLNLTDTTNLETKVYLLIKDQANISEDEIIQQLYGGSKGSSAFKMLKSRVKRKLYNQLNFLNIDSTITYSKSLVEEIRCNALLNEALILDNHEFAHLREKLTLQALKIAKLAELSSHVVRALEILRLNSSFRIFDRKRFYELSEEIQKYRQLSAVEEEARDLYLRIMVEIRVGVKNRIDHAEFIIKGVNKLFAFWQQTNSSPIYSYYYVGKSAALEALGSVTDHIKHLNDSAQLFYNGKISPLYFFYHRNQFGLTYAYLKNKQFAEGFDVAEKLKKQLELSSINWFAHMENYFLLATHSHNYGKAKEILVEVLSNSKLKSTPQTAQDRWYLYYQFYILTTATDLGFTLNYKPLVIMQDKNGYNVWYLILEFIHVLKSLDVELITRNVERLRKYVAKHFGAASDPRTRLFLKLLLIAGHEYSNVKTCRRKSRYLFQKLRQTPFAGDAYAEVEIIPYEHLWEHVLLSIGSSTQLWKNSVNSSI